MKTNRFLLSAIFGFALVFTFSCSGYGSSGNEHSSSSKTVVPSSSSVAVQEYCVYMPRNTSSDAIGICGVIEPIGSAYYTCTFGTKSDVCPNNRYGKAYQKMNMNLLNDCVKACSSGINLGAYCRVCGGSIKNNGTCTVYYSFCG